MTLALAVSAYWITECEQRIDLEEQGTSSYIGSIHTWCATDTNS